MGVTLVFMLLATLTPFLFIQMKKRAFAVVHTVLLIGMWMYFIETMFNAAPPLFSLLTVTFYLSLLAAEIGWVMFVIRLVRPAAGFQKSYQ
ncbi:hypothetical protein [Bacillus piscicola]|uniref:hypothetical protein n=1 Tax=Bacillus piscicola TaxID=1632684 RepID=UPI001F088D55|nr:hypothetical protein [Bacillus piscicola]